MDQHTREAHLKRRVELAERMAEKLALTEKIDHTLAGKLEHTRLYCNKCFSDIGIATEILPKFKCPNCQHTNGLNGYSLRNWLEKFGGQIKAQLGALEQADKAIAELLKGEAQE